VVLNRDNTRGMGLKKKVLKSFRKNHDVLTILNPVYVKKTNMNNIK
jgi:hypothetical protein